MPSVLRCGAIRVLQASLAPFLLLIAPFAGYLQYQRYGFAHREVWLFVLLLAGVALLLGAGSVLSRAFGVVTLAALLTFVADIQAQEPGLRKLGLVFLGLCALVWVLRRHAHRIVSLMAVTALALSLLPPRGGAVTSEQIAAPRATSNARPDLPLVLHVLLDEFIGVGCVRWWRATSDPPPAATRARHPTRCSSWRAASRRHGGLFRISAKRRHSRRR